MKHSTAISRLGDVADGLDRAAPWPDCTVVAAHVFGPVLDGVERVQLVLVVDEPAETLAWLSRPARLEAMAALLRFDKLPLAWWWRPAAWPVWNHHIERALRFWTVAGGRDQAALDALASGPVDPLRTDRPANREEFVAQLVVERGVYPEEHLWWATSGYLELDDAITNTTS